MILMVLDGGSTVIGGPSRERGSAFGRLVAALRLAAVAASIVGVGCARTDKESRDKERHAAVRAALAERWANVRYDSESIAAIDDPDVARALDGDLAYWLTRRRTDAVVGESVWTSAVVLTEGGARPLPTPEDVAAHLGERRAPVADAEEAASRAKAFVVLAGLRRLDRRHSFRPSSMGRPLAPDAGGRAPVVVDPLFEVSGEAARGWSVVLAAENSSGEGSFAIEEWQIDIEPSGALAARHRRTYFRHFVGRD